MNQKVVKIKTQTQLKIMAEAGKKLAKIKNELKLFVKEGENALNVEDLATRLIKREGAKPSFKMVKGYSWATCVNVNDGVVHGIPKKSIVFNKGDVVSVDVGIYFNGFHSDTSFSKAILPNEQIKIFLSVGQSALNAAIRKAKPGNRIYDLSEAMQKVIEEAGFSPIRALIGHGIGKKLHEAPPIPCFVNERRENTVEIVPGCVFAIEAMYTQGNSDVYIDYDGWTIKTKDGKISGLFEETVAIYKDGPRVLTD